MELTSRRPSLGTVLGGAALLVAATTGAATAAGTFVTIQDPTTTSAAKVSSTGRLLVGDGSGVLDVNAPRAAPSAMVRSFTEFVATPDCRTLYVPPAGKAAVITSVTASTYAGGNTATKYRLWLAPADIPCDGFVGILDANQMVVQDLGTGIVVPAGSRLSADQYRLNGAPVVSGVVAVYGYTVPASAVPAAPAPGASTPAGPGSASGG